MKLDEEKKLMDCIFEIQDLKHPLIPRELYLKEALVTQTREMHWSAIGIFGKGWLRRFRLRHSKIATRKSKDLEVAKACALCPTIAEILYINLEELYMTFHYLPSHIWNCDESGIQARRSGGTTILAKKSSKCVHSIESDQQKHLSILSCINVDKGFIPNFDIFKGTYFLEDNIAWCVEGAIMNMQPNAWMSRCLFES